MPSEFDGEWLLPCLATLAMGDYLSPETAQSAHLQLLRQRCYAMHSANRSEQCHRLLKCDAVYLTVGLTQHPKKRVRGADRGIVLGAEVRGIEALVHPRYCAWFS
eukprot:196016-Amphidinium_carterae.1